ncbi:MAG: Chk1 protein kinase [Pycnora praestabilis]|nr:MAG: Chk1 protein kinase [Pycnora praestabilis]
MNAQSQHSPLPEVPFRIVSKSIGQGAYASIRKAIPLEQPKPVFAVKLIHKAYAARYGRINAKQLALEVSLHSHIGRHQNIIHFYSTGEDLVWRWIAMELAEGGDLFDKIEADEGVGEDVAHFYFTQLISAVSYMHSKHVAHRDIKPENILLSATGDLKLADFGLATLFQYHGKTKLSKTVCGSPPYVAPEILACNGEMLSKEEAGGYAADQADIWSCGIVLFVLLVGNTPWDQPDITNWEFEEYVHNNGRCTSDIWQRLPHDSLSLLRAMIKIEPQSRFTLEDVRRHPWYTRRNLYLGPDGRLSSPISLATKMLESLRIDFSQEPLASQSSQMSTEAMDIDSNAQFRLAFTQPETPLNGLLLDWERPPRLVANERMSASQPSAANDNTLTSVPQSQRWEILSEDPSMSQFSAIPAVPLSLTQNAQKFRDIVPSHSLTRFFSPLPFSLLLPLLSESLHRLGVPSPPFSYGASENREEAAWLKVKTVDGRACGMSGDIVVEQRGRGSEGILEVRFVKTKGDPVEWRRFFKKIAVLCKDGVYKPGSRV